MKLKDIRKWDKKNYVYDIKQEKGKRVRIQNKMKSEIR